MNKRKVPKIRFKGFYDDWEQREFGDYNDLMTGYPFESDKFSEDGIKLVRGMNVKRGYLDFSEDICMRWNSCVGLENFLLKAGDILIQMDGALIGKSYAKIKENQLPALLVQRVTRSRTNNKFASQDFMYQTIQRDFLRYIEMSKTETAVPHLSLNDIRNFEIMVPCLVEQEKIGAYFSAFDRLITLHQRKLEKLKIIKKSMLENCFPENGEKVPKIRSSEFSDDWEQRKFGEVFMLLQNNTLSRAELNDEFGTVQNIHYGDVLIKYDEVLDVSKESLSYIEKQSIADKFKTSYLQNGDVIIADTAEDETVGKCTEIEGLTDQKVISGLHTMPIRPNRKFAAGFLGFYLNSAAYHDQLKPLMQGIKVTSISKGVMQDTVVKFPLDLKEQEQIGMYFSGLDHLITLHQSKLEKLKMIKKSMLETMFV